MVYRATKMASLLCSMNSLQGVGSRLSCPPFRVAWMSKFYLKIYFKFKFHFFPLFHYRRRSYIEVCSCFIFHTVLRPLDTRHVPEPALPAPRKREPRRRSAPRNAVRVREGEGRLRSEIRGGVPQAEGHDGKVAKYILFFGNMIVKVIF